MLFGGHDRGELLYPAVCFSLTFNAKWSILYHWPRKYTKAHKKNRAFLCTFVAKE
jgi:hypothetical protein